MGVRIQSLGAALLHLVESEFREIVEPPAVQQPEAVLQDVGIGRAHARHDAIGMIAAHQIMGISQSTAALMIRIEQDACNLQPTGTQHKLGMKREHVLAVVERAVGRAMHNLVQSHPEALSGHLAQSLEKRLIGMLGAELLLAMGHQPSTKLRASGERYRPSPAVRRVQHGLPPASSDQPA